MKCTTPECTENTLISGTPCHMCAASALDREISQTSGESPMQKMLKQVHDYSEGKATDAK